MLLPRLLPLTVAFALAPSVSMGCKRLADLGQSRPAASQTPADATRAAGPPSPSGPAVDDDATRAAEPPSGAGPATAGDAMTAPEGYAAMTVLRVVPTPHGNAILLEHEAEPKLVVIFVGGTEALSIELRRDRQRYPRPLTHDLLDTLVGRLGGEIVKVHVDDLKGNAFVGRVFVRQNGRIIDVDARPSDAIALALGNHAPIYVARKVIAAAGLSKDDMKGGDDVPPEVVVKPRPEPMSL